MPHSIRILAFGALLGLASCGPLAPEPVTKASESRLGGATPDAPPISGPRVSFVDIVVGTGREAHEGDALRMHYTGTLDDGSKFDSSLDRGEPLAFTLGKGEVIRGWDEGIPGMRVGGKRKLSIPAELGYGKAGAGSKIPANARLTFMVELVGVEDAPAKKPVEEDPRKKRAKESM